MPVTGDGRVERGLGGVSDLGEIQLARSDDGALRLDLSAVFETGLIHFGRHFAATDLWVNTNGTLSFGAPLPDYPTTANAGLRRDMIAVFWADLDTRLRGEGLESGLVHVDIDPVADRVSLTWEDVGLYRRNTDSPARFQVQLQDRGAGDFDIIFRYERIGLTEGSAEDDAGARVLLSSPRLVEHYLPPGLPADPGALETAPGNTGIAGLWLFEMRSGTLPGAQLVTGGVFEGGAGPDRLIGTERDDFLSGGPGDDRLVGLGGHDTIHGGEGTDTLEGGAGDDFLYGGSRETDLRDVMFGGDGHDSIDGGWGNDELHGGDGDDTLLGDFGADTLIGNAGDDLMSGGAGSDLMFGGPGNDTLNGGWGYDRLNGGTGADRFYHAGVRDHASDWIQDYTAADGDVLVFGLAGATRAQFQVNIATTPGAGTAVVAEAFVIYRPTGQIMWALVDGAGQDQIHLQLGGQIFDLLG